MRGAVVCSIIILLAGGLLAGAGCGKGPRAVASFPLDDLQEIVDRTVGDVFIDKDESADGRGALRAEALRPRVVRMFEVKGPRGLEGRLVVVTAKMKSVGMRGAAFPELWVHSPGRNELQVRDRESVVRQTSRKWEDVRVQYRCEKGEQPDLLRVNFVLDGIGRAWIDDVRITTEPLP